MTTKLASGMNLMLQNKLASEISRKPPSDSTSTKNLDALGRIFRTQMQNEVVSSNMEKFTEPDEEKVSKKIDMESAKNMFILGLSKKARNAGSSRTDQQLSVSNLSMKRKASSSYLHRSSKNLHQMLERSDRDLSEERDQRMREMQNMERFLNQRESELKKNSSSNA